jgi:hypothetical protein
VENSKKIGEFTIKIVSSCGEVVGENPAYCGKVAKNLWITGNAKE